MKKFLLADFFWQFGDALFLTIVSWYILDTLHKSEYVSNFFTITTISGIVISFAYWFLFIKRKATSIILVLNLVMITIICISLVIIKVQGPNLYVIYMLAICNGIGWNLYFPVSKILLKEIVGKEGALEGNSLSETAMQVGTLISSIIGSVLYKVLGFEIILIIIAILYFLNCIEIYTLKDIDKEQKIEYQESIKQIHLTKMICLCFAMSVPFIASICINISLAGYVKNSLFANEICYGIMNAIFGVGACLAGFYTLTKFAKEKRNIAIVVCFLMTITFGIGLFIDVSIFLTGLGMLSFGIFGPSVRIFLYTEIMQLVDEKILGVLLSVFNIIGLGVQMLITLIMAHKVDVVGEKFGFLLYSGVMLIGFLCYGITRIQKTICITNKED